MNELTTDLKSLHEETLNNLKSSKGKKMIALSLIMALILGISLTIYLIFD